MTLASTDKEYHLVAIDASVHKVPSTQELERANTTNTISWAVLPQHSCRRDYTPPVILVVLIIWLCCTSLVVKTAGETSLCANTSHSLLWMVVFKVLAEALSFHHHASCWFTTTQTLWWRIGYCAVCHGCGCTIFTAILFFIENRAIRLMMLSYNGRVEPAISAIIIKVQCIKNFCYIYQAIQCQK